MAGSDPISANFHLPKAVDMNAQGLAHLDDATLIELMIECIEWRIGLDLVAREVRTPSAQTIWNALVVVEIDLVMSAYGRLTEERRSRGNHTESPDPMDR